MPGIIVRLSNYFMHVVYFLLGYTLSKMSSNNVSAVPLGILCDQSFKITNPLARCFKFVLVNAFILLESCFLSLKSSCLLHEVSAIRELYCLFDYILNSKHFIL